MNETLKVLKERRSIRRYKAEQIRDEELNAILEAGTWAACGKGIQHCVMVVVQDPETIAYMSRLNAEIQGNPDVDPFYGAPTVVVVLGDGEKANWLQDGSLVFTADGENAVHNPLSVHIVHEGLRIDFEGEDVLFLQHENSTYNPIYPKGACRLQNGAGQP